LNSEFAEFSKDTAMKGAFTVPYGTCFGATGLVGVLGSEGLVGEISSLVQLTNIAEARNTE
jgi:hypothetical protein